MRTQIIPCGFLKVKAEEMIKPLDRDQIALKYRVDEEGYIQLSMNTLYIEIGKRKVLLDPGTADFLPMKLRREYGLEIPVPLEEVFLGSGLLPEQITDVVFTHLHFDHASGAFKRVPGNIVKRFPNAHYHVLKEHYQYALDPAPMEAGSFSTALLKYLDKIHWLEDWDMEEISFRVFNGHTKGMVVPVIQADKEKICFMSDLVPMEIFLDPAIWCGYDLDPQLLLTEKQQFLKDLDPKIRLVYFHDTLKESVLYE
jgi:glyoxylase-like metal-dependent hydrolase (beta-lactamase superfamily II)